MKTAIQAWSKCQLNHYNNIYFLVQPCNAEQFSATQDNKFLLFIS